MRLAAMGGREWVDVAAMGEGIFDWGFSIFDF
jgi:hypothetical protein